MEIQELQQIADEIYAKMDAMRAAGRSISKRNTNWASDLYHPCMRYLVYSRLNWKDKKLPEVQMIYRFEEGNQQEKIVVRDIEDVGYDIILSQKYFNYEEYEIVGRTDGILVKERKEYPIEVKSIQPFFWESTKTIEDIKNHNNFWIKKYPSQLNLYLLMGGYEGGFLVLKTFGKRLRLVPMVIDYDLGEICLKSAEQCNKAVREEKLPGRMEYNHKICDFCPFEHLCQPLKTTKFDGVIDERDYKDLVRFFDLKETAKEAGKIEKRLKEKYRGKNVASGEFEIESSDYDTTSYDIPEKIKAKYKKTKKAIRVLIKKITET